MKHAIALFAIGLATISFGQARPVYAKLSNEKSFSMVIIPDTQSYVKFDANQPLLDLMTTWTVDNLDRLNVKTVLCTGDLVEQNELCIPHGANGDQTSEQQWQAVSRSFAWLDDKNPYILCTGNHDYGYSRAENRLSRFHHYFPVERNGTWAKTLVAVGLDENGIPTLENAAYQFHDKAWGKLLVLSLEFAPRNATIEWAKGIAKRYHDHRIILLTHSYTNGNGVRIVREGYAIKDANYGQAIWDKLVKISPNIRFVLCGHWADTKGRFETNVSFSTDKNDAGQDVHQMMFNAQTADNHWSGNGGDGWLRILEFTPDGETIKVSTFSPLFGISPTTVDKAWRKGACDAFDFKISK